MKKIAGNECALLCQQLSMMISSGLSAEDRLGVVANDQPDAGLHDALLKIKNEMELGETRRTVWNGREAFDAYRSGWCGSGNRPVIWIRCWMRWRSIINGWKRSDQSEERADLSVDPADHGDGRRRRDLI